MHSCFDVKPSFHSSRGVAHARHSRASGNPVLGFHSSCADARKLQSQSFHSSCGGAGNFVLCSCKEQSHQKRMHVVCGPGGAARAGADRPRSFPMTCSSRKHRSPTVTPVAPRLSAVLLDERVCSRAGPGTGRLRSFATIARSSSVAAQILDVLSLVTFFARAKKVTRSSAGGVEALALKRQMPQSKNWIRARAGMTSKDYSAGGVEALALKRRKPEKSKNWIPACAGMTSVGYSAGGVEALAPRPTRTDESRNKNWIPACAGMTPRVMVRRGSTTAGAACRALPAKRPSIQRSETS